MWTTTAQYSIRSIGVVFKWPKMPIFWFSTIQCIEMKHLFAKIFGRCADIMAFNSECDVEFVSYAFSVAEKLFWKKVRLIPMWAAFRGFWPFEGQRRQLKVFLHIVFSQPLIDLIILINNASIGTFRVRIGPLFETSTQDTYKIETM